MTIELVSFTIPALSAVILCLLLIRQDAALYLWLYVAACGCFALGRLFTLTAFFSSGSIPQSFSLELIGLLGCFAFLASSNYGVIDGIMDDRSELFRKYRFIASIAPAITTALILPAVISAGSVSLKVTFAVLSLAVGISSYYSLKQIICPDMGFEFLSVIKPCNGISLALALFSSIYILGAGIESVLLKDTACILSAVLFIPLAFAIWKGVKLWTI